MKFFVIYWVLFGLIFLFAVLGLFIPVLSLFTVFAIIFLLILELIKFKLLNKVLDPFILYPFDPVS